VHEGLCCALGLMAIALANWAAALDIFDGIKHHFQIPG